MGRPSKPMPKNANSKFTTRNNKQDIFSGMEKSSQRKAELSKKPLEASNAEEDKTNP